MVCLANVGYRETGVQYIIFLSEPCIGRFASLRVALKIYFEASQLTVFSP